MKKIIIVLLLLNFSGLYAQQVIEDKLVLKESPEGVFIYLSSKSIGEKSNSGITHVLIERMLPGEKNYSSIGQATMVGSVEEFKNTANPEMLKNIMQMKKLKSEKEAWEYLLSHPSADDYGFLALDSKFMSAMGMMYIDRQVKTISKSGMAQYKASFIKRDNTTGYIITGKITLGATPSIRQPKLLSKKEDDTHISIIWTADKSTSPDAMFADVYKSDDFSKGYKKTGRIIVNTDTVTQNIRYIWTEQVAPFRFYRYYLVPVTIAGLPGPASDTVQVVSVNASSIKVVTAMSATDSSKGVLLQWHPVPANTLVTGLRIERSRGAAEGYIPIDTVSAFDSAYWDLKVIPGYSYYYRLRTITIRNDSFPPSAFASVTVKANGMFLQSPSGLKATSEKGKIQLAWNKSAQPQIAGYIIYRSNGINDSLKILQPLIKDTLYIDTLLLSAGNQYKYAVKAVDYEMQSSEFSDIVYAHIADIKIMEPPTGLSVSAEPGKISLLWNNMRATDTRIWGYNIYRFSGDAPPEALNSNLSVTDLTRFNFKKINSSINTATIYSDYTVEQGQRYYYAVTAVNSDGTESISSSVSEVEVPFVVWSAPAQFGLEKSDKGIVISWGMLQSAGAKECLIYRRASTDLQPQKIATVKFSDKKYTDATAQTGVVYFYSIALSNEKQTSATSLEKGIVR